MKQSARTLQRAAIHRGKFATERFREAIRTLNPTVGYISEISQEEFVARRNKNCSRFYKFRHSLDNPLSAQEIKNLFKS
jgi:hypothetical protein